MQTNMKAKTAIPTTNPISPVIEPTIMYPQQFTIPNHSYVVPQPPSINTVSIPLQQPSNVITVGNATYVRIDNNNNPYKEDDEIRRIRSIIIQEQRQREINQKQDQQFDNNQGNSTSFNQNDNDNDNNYMNKQRIIQQQQFQIKQQQHQLNQLNLKMNNLNMNNNRNKKCYSCGIVGHIAMNCKKRGNSNRTSYNNNKNYQNQKQVQVNYQQNAVNNNRNQSMRYSNNNNQRYNGNQRNNNYYNNNNNMNRNNNSNRYQNDSRNYYNYNNNTTNNNNNPMAKPYTITHAASSNTSAMLAAMLSSNKNVTHKRTFQSGLNTEKLRHSRQHDRLQLRRSERENRLQQKREVLRNINKIIDLTDNYNNQSKVSNIDTNKNGKTSNRAGIVSNNKENVISNNKKEILESKTQQLILNNNKKKQRADNSQNWRNLHGNQNPISCARHPQIDESRRREKFPTLEQIDELKDGEYFVYDKEVIVRCNYKKKDGNSIGFSCPFCFNKYKKNGQPCKRAKASQHFHGCGSKHIKNGAMGSCGTRSPHCSYVYPKYGSQYRMAPFGIQFHLYVTPSTKVE